jgi:hypothetical protein
MESIPGSLEENVIWRDMCCSQIGYAMHQNTQCGLPLNTTIMCNGCDGKKCRSRQTPSAGGPSFPHGDIFDAYFDGLV